jgi:hypothetical protein
MPIERGEDALDNLLVGQVTALVGYAQGCQAEASGSDAAHSSRVEFSAKIVLCAIQDLAGFLAALLPEKEATLALEVVQECFIVPAQPPGRICKNSTGRKECGSSQQRDGAHRVAAAKHSAPFLACYQGIQVFHSFQLPIWSRFLPYLASTKLIGWFLTIDHAI